MFLIRPPKLNEVGLPQDQFLYIKDTSQAVRCGNYRQGSTSNAIAPPTTNGRNKAFLIVLQTNSWLVSGDRP